MHNMSRVETGIQPQRDSINRKKERARVLKTGGQTSSLAFTLYCVTLTLGSVSTWPQSLPLSLPFWLLVRKRKAQDGSS